MKPPTAYVDYHHFVTGQAYKRSYEANRGRNSDYKKIDLTPLEQRAIPWTFAPDSGLRKRADNVPKELQIMEDCLRATTTNFPPPLKLF